jgi:hypothetical protein
MQIQKINNKYLKKRSKEIETTNKVIENMKN